MNYNVQKDKTIKQPTKSKETINLAHWGKMMLSDDNLLNLNVHMYFVHGFVMLIAWFSECQLILIFQYIDILNLSINRTKAFQIVKQCALCSKQKKIHFIHEPFSVMCMEQFMQETFCTSLFRINHSIPCISFNFAYTKLCMLW